MTLYSNQASHNILQTFLAEEEASVLVCGPEGIGLKTLVEAIISTQSLEIIPVLPEKNDKVDIDAGRITVDSIRRLYDLTKTVNPHGRVVIIDYAERMATPAQNAFLKLLEEPPQGTRFILLSHKPELLLPTILSRVQRVDMRPISRQQSEALLDELNVQDTTKRTQLLFIAGGLPALVTRLVKDDKLFEERANIVKDARTLITGTPYERLLLAKHYKDSREKALTLIEDAMKQVKGSVAQTGGAKAIATLEQLEKTHRRITEQGNVRLQLSSLVVVY